MPCYAAHLQNGEMILSTKHEHQVGEMQFMAQLFRLGTVRLVGFFALWHHFWCLAFTLESTYVWKHASARNIWRKKDGIDGIDCNLPFFFRFCQVQGNDEGQAGDNEADAFRQLQSRRKKKATEFFADRLTTFHLLLTLSVAMASAPVTHYLFRLGTMEKDGIERKMSKRAEESMKCRIRHKGAIGEPQPQKPAFHKLLPVVMKAIDRMWQELLGPSKMFSCAKGFWPGALPQSPMHKEVSDNILRTIAALKWRLVEKLNVPPYSLAAATEASNSVEEVDKILQDFLEMSPCCLDAEWSAPIQAHLAAMRDRVQRRQEFLRIVKGLHFRVVSLSEEQQHAMQRKFSTTFGQAPSLSTQCARTLIQTMHLGQFFFENIEGSGVH